MTNAEKLYDAMMRTPVIAFDLLFLLRELDGIRQTVAPHPYFGNDIAFYVLIASRVAILVFLLTCIAFHASRYRPVGKHERWYPKIVALLGMLFTLLILLTPRAPSDVFWDGLSTVLILIGTIASNLVLFDLGRSFSVMPEARKLIMGGFYARIRHPLYLAEEITVLGIFLQFRSWQALLILVVHFYFQIRRMDFEEGILKQTFPAYSGYVERTNRLFPGLY